MENFKRGVVLFFAFLLCIHLCFTFIYNFDKVTSNPTLRFVVFKYMFPFFNQNNKIFAPDPPFCKQQLLVKFKTKKGAWTGYLNPQQEMLERHVHNRLSPIGTQIKHYDYMLRHVYDAHLYAEYYLRNNSDSLTNKNELKMNYLLKNDGFNMAQRYFSDLVNKSSKAAHYDSLQFRVCYVYPQKYKAMPLNKIKSSALIIDFPSLPIRAANGLE